MSLKKDKVIIVGAGLVGSLLAALMARRGYAVDVYEKRPDPRTGQVVGGRSINLALSNRGWKALSLIGADDAVRRIALPMKQRIMHDEAGQLSYQAYGKEGEAIYSVSRAMLNEILMEEADYHSHVNFYFSHTCEEIDYQSNTATFKSRESGEHVTVTGDVFFGADGAFSAMRSAMQKSDRFNYSQRYIESGYKELEIPAKDGDFAISPDGLHIWPRGSFMMIALPNPDKTFTATLFLPFEGEKAFENIGTFPAFQSFLQQHFADILPLIPNLEQDFHKNPVSSLVTVRCSPWVKGRFALIGDAAHAIVPFYGQGMNSGFEDCTVLDGLVEAFDGNWQDVLPHYQNDRIENGNAISDLALHNFIEMRDSVADPDFLLQKKMEAKINEQYPAHWMPLYSMVTFSHTPYKDALQKGRDQDRVMKQIMQYPEVRDHWQSIDFGKFIDFETTTAKPLS